MSSDTQDANRPNSNNSADSKLYKNPISLAGIALAAVAFLNILFLVFLDAFSHVSSPYVGILAYMVAPAIMVVGLIAIPIGMVIERRRRHHAVGARAQIWTSRPEQSGAAQHHGVRAQLCCDLCADERGRQLQGLRVHRLRDVLRTVVPHRDGSGIHGLPAVAARSRGLRGVSRRLGGGLVREVEALWHSPGVLHGDGHLSAANSDASAQPASGADTCEQCHWPKKFWGAQLKTFSHYGTDEQNTPRVLRLLIKTGGGDPGLGQSTGGIHWHMNIANQMTYIATDEQRQVIPWVRMEDNKGNIVDFASKDAPPTQEQIDKGDKRKMDCIDCHNRPSHIYTPPDLSVDRSLVAGSIDPSLPFIKAQGVEALIADYKTQDEGTKAIAEKIPKFYQEKYPQIASAKADRISAAVTELQRIYSTTIFPAMKVNWKTHPNNIGHMYYPGLLPLPRWQPRQQGRQGHQQGLQFLPHAAGSGRGIVALGADAGAAVQASGGYRRPDGGELRRLPQRRSGTVGS